MKIKEFQLERFFAQHEFAVQHLLCASDCQSLTVRELAEIDPSLNEQLARLSLGYTESDGHPELRAEIAKIYNGIQPEQVLVFAGAEEAIYLFMNSEVQSGDHVIVHSPSYQSLHEVARSRGAEVEAWNASEVNDWSLDLNELQAKLKSNTRFIVINTPHNPTGYLMNQEDWQALHYLANERGIRLFCDEVYRESEYDPADRLPGGCEMGPQSLSLGVMSKTYGLAGLRIGWIASQDAALMDRMRAMKDYSSICNSAPSELMATIALRHRETLVKRNVGICQRNLDELSAFVDRHSDQFSMVRPKAGSIAFPRNLGGETEAFCQRLITDHGVLLAPGLLFGDWPNHFRIGFGRTNFYDGLMELEASL